MKIKKISFVLFLSIHYIGVSQAAIISEIMYDPSGSDTGREWVEVFNDSSSSIDLTQYKLFENNVNHSVSISQGNSIISPGGYAIIADNPSNFLNDFPDFAGALFDSAFSLSNTGESLSLKDSSQSVVFSTVYTATTSASGTGGSLNYATSSYEVFLATPGSVSDYRPVPASGNSSNTTNQTAVNLYNSDPGRRTYTLGDMYLLAPQEIYGVAGSDIDFNLKVLDKNKAPIVTNTYWSFGDGYGKYGATSTHRYVFPGEYNALVEVDVPAGFGVEKIKVNVLKPDISITDLSTNPPSITIKNNSDDELDLQYASIKSDEGVYPLSKHLIISPKAEIKISGLHVGFNNLTNPKIIFTNGQVISEYNKTFKNILGESISQISTSSYFLATNVSYNISSTVATTNPAKIVKKPIVIKKVATTTASFKLDQVVISTTTIPEIKEKNSSSTPSFFKKIFYFLY